jgi:outer membrane cobalamin receptor
MTGLYKGRQYTDDLNENMLDEYFTLDMSLSKPVRETLILVLDIKDVFDNVHMETNDYISPGRLITARVNFRF